MAAAAAPTEECREVMRQQCEEAKTLAMALSAVDLVCIVAKRPKHKVARNGRRPSKRPAKKGIDVFLDNLSVFGDLEEAAEGGVADQSIAVWQTLSVTYAWREKLQTGLS
jgi:hypothetical protein